ncbi:MAG: insulinase family protein [Cognatishimia sp.]
MSVVSLFGWYQTRFDTDIEGVFQLPSDRFAQVLVYSKAQKREITAYLIFPRGEGQNTKQEGLAHFVEHLAAEKIMRVSRQQAQHSNAWTNSTSTGYWLNAKKAALPAALQALANTAKPLEVTEEFADAERDIVLGEYEYRVVDQALSTEKHQLNSELYEDGPISRWVGGMPDDIAQYSLAAAQALHADSHRLSEAVLVVHGDISARGVAQAMKQINTADVPHHAARSVQRLVTQFTEGRYVTSVRSADDIGPVLLYGKLVALPSCVDQRACGTAINVLHRLLDTAQAGGIAGPLRYDAFVARSFDLDINLVGPNIAEVWFEARPDKGVSLQTLLTTFETSLEAALAEVGQTNRYLTARRQAISDLKNVDSAIAYEAGWAVDRFARGLKPVGRKAYMTALGQVKVGPLKAVAQDLSMPGRVVIVKVNPLNERLN